MTFNWESVEDDRYCYDAYISDVYDGDTVTCDIDLGFGIVIRKQKIRLYGIDAPEMRGKERPHGKVTRNRLRELILDKTVRLYTISDKKGKYGRWLGVICVGDRNINQLLIDENLAEQRLYV